jgi:hypothetical protein
MMRSRELERHSDRLRVERPILSTGCQWCDGLGLDPVGMPGEPCPECCRPLRPWVKKALRLAWLLLLAAQRRATIKGYRENH